MVSWVFIASDYLYAELQNICLPRHSGNNVFIAVKAGHVAEWSPPFTASDPACIQPPALKYSLSEEGCPGLVISGKITKLR